MVDGERPAGLAPLPRGEEGVVDARRHDGDPARVGAVEGHDLLGLDRAGGQHRIGAGDDHGLGGGPAI